MNDIAQKRMMIAAGAGVLAFVIFLLLISFGFVLSVILGGVVFALLMWLLPQSVVTSDPTVKPSGAPKSAANAAPTTARRADPVVDPIDTMPAAGVAAPTAAATAAIVTTDAVAEPAPGSAPKDDPADDAAAKPMDQKPETIAETPVKKFPATEEKPEGLSAPRSGGADDLKKISGVGPKMEAMLNGMGVYHFDQIAAWGPAQVQWADDNLKGFKGRVSRDEWVRQAGTLAKTT